MIRTGIFGGSFNPVHKGHIALAEEICRHKLVDEVWLMVSPQNPFKQSRHLLPDALRLELTRIAVKRHRKLKISDFEFHMPRPSYMAATLKLLKQTYSARSFTLIIGADNWSVFNQWYHYEEILENYHIIVYPRKGQAIDRESLPHNVVAPDMPLYPMNSTDIRKRLSKGISVSNVLDPEVEQLLQNYIRKNPEEFRLTV